MRSSRIMASALRAGGPRPRGDQRSTWPRSICVELGERGQVVLRAVRSPSPRSWSISGVGGVQHVAVQPPAVGLVGGQHQRVRASGTAARRAGRPGSAPSTGSSTSRPAIARRLYISANVRWIERPARAQACRVGRGRRRARTRATRLDEQLAVAHVEQVRPEPGLGVDDRRRRGVGVAGVRRPGSPTPVRRVGRDVGRTSVARRPAPSVLQRRGRSSGSGRSATRSRPAGLEALALLADLRERGQRASRASRPSRITSSGAGRSGRHARSPRVPRCALAVAAAPLVPRRPGRRRWRRRRRCRARASGRRGRRISSSKSLPTRLTGGAGVGLARAP